MCGWTNAATLCPTFPCKSVNAFLLYANTHLNRLDKAKKKSSTQNMGHTCTLFKNCEILIDLIKYCIALYICDFQNLAVLYVKLPLFKPFVQLK
jgi:hypothetical protein